MPETKLEDLVGSIDALPTLPSVVARVNDLVEDPSASAGDINEVIAHDMALSSKILKLVNSAFYGFPRRISSITHAVVILGFQTVRNIALSAFVLDAFDSTDLPFGYRDFWIHSVGAGVAANVVGTRQGLPVGDDAFMCGLLHDIGKLVLHQYMREDFRKVMDMVQQEDLTIIDAEGKVLQADHAEVGALLMEHWQLPEKMVAVLRYHHHPDQAPEPCQKLVATVHLADILARSLLIGSGGDQKIPDASEAAWHLMGLTEADLPELMQGITEDMAKTEAFIDLIQASSEAK
jgi:putative nucleotidyltransferase with HDIG domain